MQNVQKTSWLGPSPLAYLMTGMGVVLASWVMSGCRFGNHVEPAPTPQPSENPDKYTGAYIARPQSLVYCSTTDTDTTCKGTPINKIPAEISDSISNPVIFQLMDLKTGRSRLYNINRGGGYWPVFLDQGNGKLAASWSTDVIQLWWKSTACGYRYDVWEEGRVTQEGKGSHSNEGYLLSGTVQLEILVIQNMVGDCAAPLSEMTACYADTSKCLGADDAENARIHERVQETFNDYIEAGALLPDDIKRVTALSFKVKYE